MKEQPTEMTLASLDVLIMPNGEILCGGKSLGYFRELQKYLSNPRDVATGKPIKEVTN